MPSMANITVKDAANVDVIYTAATPAGGDKSPAVWRANALQTQISWRPTFSMATRTSAGNKPGRIADFKFTFPIVETIGGVDTNTAIVPFSGTVTLPTNVDALKVKDAFTQLGNLMAATLVRSSVEEGYAPS